MAMFSNYQDTSANIPNNLDKAFPVINPETKLKPLDDCDHYSEYDFAGNLVGYTWAYGETVSLQFDITGAIDIANDAIIFSVSGEEPTLETAGSVGQKAYNIIDFRCWYCRGSIEDKYYIWEEDKDCEICSCDVIDSAIPADQFLVGKAAYLCIYDFRHNIIKELQIPAAATLVFNLDEQLSAELQPGIYYCSVDIKSDTDVVRIFDTTDGILNVR